MAWLALAVLMPRPPVPDPGRRLPAVWGVVTALVGFKVGATGAEDLRVGGWMAVLLAVVLVALSAWRSVRTEDLGHA